MKKLTILFFAIHFSLFTLSAQNISTIAGNHTFGYVGDGGPATSAELYYPSAVFANASGEYYIADYGNNVIRKVDGAGNISTVAGNNIQGYGGDGGAAISAELYDPSGIAVDTSGNIYIADTYNYVVRKVDVSGIISTIAGNHIFGFSGDGGQATSAELYQPSGVAIDLKGNLYIADHFNFVIRKVSPSGIITSCAGIHAQGYSGDGGPATMAELNFTDELSCDKTGNLFISDAGNNVIRKVDTMGVITTVAGNNVQGYSGDGGQATSAELNSPWGMASDDWGDLFIADYGNNTIRIITSSGVIATVAGNHIQGFFGDGGPATSAELFFPTSVIIDNSGNLLVCDDYNHVIRKVDGIATGIPSHSTSHTSISVSPNPAQNQITIQLSGNNNLCSVEMYSVTGQKVLEQKLTPSLPVRTLQPGGLPQSGGGASVSHRINTSSLSDGLYFLKVKMGDGSILVKKIEVLK